MTSPIVGIGELLWDVYPDGRKVAGGAPFNFAFHCHQLGHSAVIVSRVGDDDLGRELRQQVRQLGLSDQSIQTDPDRPTGTVMVRLDANAVPTYTITENVAWDHIGYDGFEEIAVDAAAVCFGTLAQRNKVSAETIRRVVRQATGLKVFDVNLRGPVSRETLQPGLFESQWVKVNDAELDELARLLAVSPHDLMTAPRQMGAGAQTAWIVTRGPDGCDVLTPGGTVHEPGVPARVVDTVGAGDAFTAAMVCLYLEGRSLRECARFANHYAAKVCEHPGGTPRIERAEVEREAFGYSPRVDP